MNRLMRKLLPACAALTLLLGAQQALTAPPSKGGSKGDTTPPATVTDLAVTPTVRALTLKFTATGDDGMSGTAVRYDIRYREGMGTDCQSDPGSWTLAARSMETTAEASGTVDYFAVRAPDGLASHGLAPDTAYCVAIRVLDEVDRPATPAMWARAESSTLPGDWRLVALPAAPAGATAQHTTERAVVDPDDPTRILLAWNTRDINGNTVIPGVLRFASLSAGEIGKTGDQNVSECSGGPPSDCVETVPNDWKKFFDQSAAGGGSWVATFHEVPGTDKVGAFFVRGVKAGSITRKNAYGVLGAIVIERDSSGTWTIVGDNNDGAQPLNDPAFIPFSPDTQGLTWSTLAYASDGAGAFRPAVAWRAVVADTSSYQKAVVNYSERSEYGWSNPIVLSARETGGGASAGELFRRRHLFNKPDGTLAILLDGSEDLRVHTIYAERVRDEQLGQWKWRHYLVDPRRNDHSRVTYDAQGKLLLADGWYGTAQVSVFREPAQVVWQGETSTTPLPSHDFRNPTPYAPLNSWTLVHDDPSFTSAHFYVRGASVDACGNAHIATAGGRLSGNGTGETWEQRALMADESASYPGAPASEERIDATSYWAAGAVALTLPDGDRIVGYDWGYVGGFATSYSPRPPNYLYLARSSTGCSP